MALLPSTPPRRSKTPGLNNGRKIDTSDPALSPATALLEKNAEALGHGGVAMGGGEGVSENFVSHPSERSKQISKQIQALSVGDESQRGDVSAVRQLILTPPAISGDAPVVEAGMGNVRVNEGPSSAKPSAGSGSESDGHDMDLAMKLCLDGFNTEAKGTDPKTPVHLNLTVNTPVLGSDDSPVIPLFKSDPNDPVPAPSSEAGGWDSPTGNTGFVPHPDPSLLGLPPSSMGDDSSIDTLDPENDLDASSEATESRTGSLIELDIDEEEPP